LRVEHKRAFNLVEVPVVDFQGLWDVAASEALNELFMVMDEAWRTRRRQVQRLDQATLMDEPNQDVLHDLVSGNFSKNYVKLAA
jgi:hypothetical protein